MLLVHIAAGAIALVSGAVALYAVKGARAHRTSGIIFVYAMCTMCALGIVLAILHGAAPTMNIPAAMLTGYLVVTGLRTVRPDTPDGRRFDVRAMQVGLATGIGCIAFGLEAIGRGGRESGMAFPLFMFAAVALLAVAGDRRMLRSGPLRGGRRIARHLWRMCYAFWIAVMSFFIGQADVFPEPLRVRPLLAMPVVAVLAIMVYWLRRVRVESRGAARHSAPTLAAPAKSYV
jgi:uncharacterized membrane protein